MTGVPKAVICAILSVGWYIEKSGPYSGSIMLPLSLSKWSFTICAALCNPRLLALSGSKAGQVRSGQVRVFNMHIQSKLLQRMPVTGTCTSLCRILCPGQEKKWEGVRGNHLHWQVEGSTINLIGIGIRQRVV